MLVLMMEPSLETLPEGVMVSILALCPVMDRFSLMQVSKEWWRAGRSRALWRRLALNEDLKDGFGDGNLEKFRGMLNWIRPEVLILEGDGVHREHLLAAADYGQLKELQLLFCRRIREEDLRTFTANLGKRYTASECHGRHSNHLSKVEISARQLISRGALQTFFTEIPSVHSVSCLVEPDNLMMSFGFDGARKPGRLLKGTRNQDGETTFVFERTGPPSAISVQPVFV